MPTASTASAARTETTETTETTASTGTTETTTSAGTTGQARERPHELPVGTATDLSTHFLAPATGGLRMHVANDQQWTAASPMLEEPDWCCYEGQPEELTRAVCAWLMSTAPSKTAYGSDPRARIAAGEERLARLVHTLSTAGLDAGTSATEAHIDKFCAWLQACYFDGISTSDHGPEARRLARQNNHRCEQLCSQQQFGNLASELPLGMVSTGAAAAIAEAEAVARQVAELHARLAEAKVEGQQLAGLASKIRRHQSITAHDGDRGDSDDDDLVLVALWPDEDQDDCTSEAAENEVEAPSTEEELQTERAEKHAQTAAPAATTAKRETLGKARLLKMLTGLHDARRQHRLKIARQQKLHRLRQYQLAKQQEQQRQAQLADVAAQWEAVWQWHQYQADFRRLEQQQQQRRRLGQLQAQRAHAAAVAELIGAYGQLGHMALPVQRNVGPRSPWNWHMRPHSALGFPYHTAAVLG